MVVANGKFHESSFGFGFKLRLGLVKSLMEAKVKVGGLTTNLERSIHETLRNQVAKPATIATSIRPRCACCIDILAKGPG